MDIPQVMDHPFTQGMQVAANNKYKGNKVYLQQTMKHQMKNTYMGKSGNPFNLNTHAHSQS